MKNTNFHLNHFRKIEWYPLIVIFSTVRLVQVLYIFIRIFVCELIWSIKFMSNGVSFLFVVFVDIVKCLVILFFSLKIYN